MTHFRTRSTRLTLAVLAAFAVATPAWAQTPAAPPAPPAAANAPAESGLSAFGWLAGCWRGSVNQREFREQWLPLRGGLLLGVGHTVAAERTQDFEYLRIEERTDGIHYVAVPVRQKEASFRLVDRKSEGPDTIFTFASAGTEFPQSIIYRRGTEGWLYVHVEGKLGGEDRRIIYPFRRVDCETDELIRN